MSDLWKNKQTYKIGKWTVYIVRGRTADPVKWYTELHINDRYISSRGSNAPTKILAVIQTILRGDK